MSKILSITTKQLRYTQEVFTKAELTDKESFLKGLNLLKEKGFKLNIREFELTNTICVTIEGLKSDKAESYAIDLLKRGLMKEGFIFPFSIQRH